VIREANDNFHRQIMSEGVSTNSWKDNVLILDGPFHMKLENSKHYFYIGLVKKEERHYGTKNQLGSDIYKGYYRLNKTMKHIESPEEITIHVLTLFIHGFAYK
jgi:hypothetical protein